MLFKLSEVFKSNLSGDSKSKLSWTGCFQTSEDVLVKIAFVEENIYKGELPPVQLFLVGLARTHLIFGEIPCGLYHLSRFSATAPEETLFPQIHEM